MAQLSAWMGASVVAAGVSAALIAGVDTASADTGSDTSGTATASTTDSADRGPRRTDDTAGEHSKTRGASHTDASDTDDTNDASDTDDASDADDQDDVDVDDTDTATDLGDDAEAEETPDSSSGDIDDPDAESDTAPEPGSDGSATSSDDAPPVDQDVAEPQDHAEVTPVAPESDATNEAAGVETDAQSLPVGTSIPTGSAVDTAAAQRVSATVTAPAALAAAQPRTFQDIVQSLMMEIIGAAVRFVSGPPVVPPGSNVTVRSSRLEIAEGHTIRADWYYPDGTELPQRIIYLQHGYLGIGPMYSYTAAWLAERTNSIVVAPTLSSNRYVRDGFWLGDDQVYRATADLFLGDRDALTASAVAAGFAWKYGRDAALPDRFTLVGHSLGAGVAAGAAGYYADKVTASGGTSQLAGIVLLDGAPPGNVLPVALDKLDGLGAYIPVFELGAPKDPDPRRVDAALNEHRPGHFNGVVLDGGQHLDSMEGGSWLIQLVSHLYQGFPTEQNQAAAQTLIAGWVNDIFAGRIDPSTGACAGADCAGIYGAPGQAITLATPKGPASGVVIGTAVAPTVTEFQPQSVISLVSRRSPAVRLLIEG